MVSSFTTSYFLNWWVTSSNSFFNLVDVIDTQFAINSGDWGWLALHQLPSSPNAWYVNRWFAVIDANTYVNVQFIKAVWPTVE
jgi:hypothetical protein